MTLNAAFDTSWTNRLPMARFVRGPSVAQCLSGPHAKANAFNTIRLLAALLVIFSHSFLLLDGTYALEPVWRLSHGQTTVGSLAVGAFFVISGLLITASYERSRNLGDFARKRILRIMPAFVVVIALLVLVAGPILTSEPLAGYFGERRTWAFFAHLIFVPAPVTLIGVFDDHVVKTINESIWTLRYEVLCYAMTPLLMLRFMGARFKVVLAWVASFLIVRFWPNADNLDGIEFYIVASSRMFRYFGAGMVIYLYRDQLRLDWRLACGCCALLLALAPSVIFVEASATLGAYALICLGFLAPQKFASIANKVDLSYGVYLYGWPIQQLYAPFLYGTYASWLSNTALAVPTALLAGWLSWHLVERPALRLKRAA